MHTSTMFGIAAYIFIALLSALFDREQILLAIREMRVALVTKRIGRGTVTLGLAALAIVLLSWPFRLVAGVASWANRHVKRNRVDLTEKP